MAFGINRKELATWKEKVQKGELAFLTHYWIHPKFPENKTVTKAGCSDIGKLVRWGKQYGLKEEWIDRRPEYPHFDLIGIKQVEILFQEGLESHIEKFRLPSLNEQHSFYAIHLKIFEKKLLQIGKLGTYEFPEGTYIYIGSAKRNIRARIARHIKKVKPLRWHFDYLRPHGEITKFETFDNKLDECTRCKQLKEMYQAKEIVKGFGSSDCRCQSHLLYIPRW